MGITIKDAPLVEQLSGDEKIPISDGSNEPRTVNVEQIKEFSNKDIEIPKKVSELENDSGYATSKEVEDAISKIPTPDVGGQISAALVDYVKKVEGKGLSTNDFTNELKTKLGTIIPNDISELEDEIGKLETTLNTLVGGNASNAIESFNEIIAFLKNVSDTESLSGIIAGINTRIAEVEAKIPTKVSELENDKNYLTEHQSLSHLATKDELKSKQDVISDLANIREGAAKGATAIQEEQYKGTIAAVDTDESVDDPNVPSGSYDDTELKNQIANLETEVSKKADEAETASKLTELGQKVEKLDGALNGAVDLDIANTLTWTNGVWNYEVNGGSGSDYIKQTFRYSNKIDISGYDSVKLSGLMNGSSISAIGSTVPTIIFFGDGEPIGWKMYQPGESFVVLTTDYSQYNKLEIVLNAYQSEAAYVPSIKVTKEGGLSKDVKDLKKESASVEETVSKLETSILGVDNVDIADTLTWTKGLWHYQNNTGGGNDYQKQTFRYSNKIDISDYDSVKLSGLWNGTSTSGGGNTMASITFFGDNEPIKFIQVVDGESYVIFRSDYRQYDKLEIVLNSRQSEKIYVPSVVVYKNNVFDGVFVPKRIVLCGDSLMGNESSLITLQLNSIAKAQGYEIVRHTMGGENIIGNLTRNGGIAIRVTSDFVMPTSGSIDIEVESAWMKSDGTYAQNPYNNATNRDVRIMSVKGKMTRNSSTSYTFTRNDEGESFKVGIGTLLWDEALWSCKDYPHIWFTGQNMGYENEQDWADMINMAARNFGENFIVCSTALSGTTNQLVRCATKSFGDKYINLKAYTEGQAVYDGQRFGLIDSSALASDYGSLFWPGTDKVHQNNLLSYMWAALMWNTLLDLGYVEGNRIETGEYYKQ